MLKYFTESLLIGISRQRVKVWKLSGLSRSKISVMAVAHLPDEAFSDQSRFCKALSAVLKQSKCDGLSVHIVLADELVRLFMVTPPGNVGRLADCRAAAAMRFHALYDESPSAWKIDADWHIHKPFLACAAPQTLLSALNEACAANRLKIMEVRPHFIKAYNTCFKQLGQDAWLAGINGSMLTLGATDCQRLVAVRQIVVSDKLGEQETWLPQYLERESLRLNLPAPKRLQLYGELSVPWANHQIGSFFCTRVADPITRSGPPELNDALVLPVGEAA